MTIEYYQPLVRGFDRMKKALFQPFDLRKWCLVGFTAFLAGATEWQGGGSGRFGPKHNGDIEDVLHFPEQAREWLTLHPGWASLIAAGLVLLAGLIVLITWLSSRGRFMFLDNVVHDRDRVSEPWHEYRNLGNSLFVWQLAFGLITLAVFLAYLGFCFSILHRMMADGLSVKVLAWNALPMVLGLSGLILIAVTITVFWNDFVVAIMYKHGLETAAAWRRFWNVFKIHPVHFFLYGIVVFFLRILVVMLVAVVGVITCCIGFILLAIPYVNSVVTLPISYTLRTFSLEYLAQFGGDFNVFPSPKGKKTGTAKTGPVKRRTGK